MFAINIVTALISLVCALIIWRIYRLIGGRGRVLLAFAFIYATVIRAVVVVSDAADFEFNSRELMFGFWVLVLPALWMLLREIESTLKPGK